MILKLGMDHRGLKVYKVYINDDPVLTLTYFMQRSNVVKIAYCAYTRPRCQVCVYRTIGTRPLVLWFIVVESKLISFLTWTEKIHGQIC